jgi:hypothetical protein
MPFYLQIEDNSAPVKLISVSNPIASVSRIMGSVLPCVNVKIAKTNWIPRKEPKLSNK